MDMKAKLDSVAESIAGGVHCTSCDVSNTYEVIEAAVVGNAEVAGLIQFIRCGNCGYEFIHTYEESYDH